MKDGVIVLNSNQRILYINPITEKLFNRTESDALGQPFVFVSEIYQERLAPFLTGGEQRAEIMIGEGNQAKVFEATVSPVSSLNASKAIGPDSIITLHDITQRKEAEIALSRRESIMSAIGLAAEQFLKESTWEHNIPGVLEKIGQAANVSRVYVFMNDLDEQGRVFTSQRYEWAAAGVLPQINNPNLQRLNLREAGFKRWEDHLSKGKSLHGISSGFPKSEQELLKDQKILSMAILPIFVDKQWWGFIGFDECKYERHWTGTELEALHIAASIFGSAETRARTEQKLIHRQRTLNLLHDIVIVSLQSDDLLSMSQTLVDRLGALINADGCFLTLWNENNQQAIPLAAYGPYKETYRSLTIQPGERTFTQSALKIRQTLVIEDVSTSPYIEHDITQKFPTRSMLVLPLIAGKKNLGAIMLAFNQTHHFQPEEIAISEQAAGLIALALEKFQAMEQAQRRAMASETLRKASAAITGTLETEEAVTRILEQLDQVVPYDSASVQLLDGNELEIIGGRGWDNQSDIMGMRFTVPGDNPNSVVLEKGKPYILPEAWKVYKKFNEPPHNHIRSWLGVPLIIQNKIIGLLAIDSAEANHFTEDDASLASTFANQVAVVLENARIFKETQDQAITDSLTGIYNRRGLFQLGEFEFTRARRIDRPFCAMILDIDRFKRVNDHYGHATGDQALRGLADRCRNSSRAVDLVSRYGGEEFVILLPETPIDSAKLVAERLRVSIMENPITTDSGPLRITISIGIAEANNADTLKTLIERADAALYEAKHEGRNCVRIMKST
jgi:diguanylate cyclase (GGDEF)-like protein